MRLRWRGLGDRRRNEEGRNAGCFAGVSLEDGDSSELCNRASTVLSKGEERMRTHDSPLDVSANLVKLGRFEADLVGELAGRLSDVLCYPM